MIPPALRPLNPDDEAELQLVASRMRDTLMEVLGPAQGASMYTMEWLVDRVRWHLNPELCVGQVFVVEDDAGRVVGHSIVRVEPEETGGRLGLISTTYVVPERRRAGLAEALLRAGEAWLIAHGATQLATNTSETNWPLLRLYQKAGYQITDRAPEAKMVQLSRAVGDEEAERRR
ncbi:MAG: GNAT family N-acetyltransferase [Deltaproteobacteria bacterium]|nr:GNAT family N-acetyltransferase [Deltaproteobacteria bacterium]